VRGNLLFASIISQAQGNRCREEDDGVGCFVVLVGRMERDSPSFNQNVLSNFPSIIRLREYSVDETFGILKERARLALDSSSYADSPLRKIAERIGGNVTMANEASARK